MAPPPAASAPRHVCSTSPPAGPTARRGLGTRPGAGADALARRRGRRIHGRADEFSSEKRRMSWSAARLAAPHRIPDELCSRGFASSRTAPQKISISLRERPKSAMQSRLPASQGHTYFLTRSTRNEPLLNLTAIRPLDAYPPVARRNTCCIKPSHSIRSLRDFREQTHKTPLNEDINILRCLKSEHDARDSIRSHQRNWNARRVSSDILDICSQTEHRLLNEDCEVIALGAKPSEHRISRLSDYDSPASRR